MKQQNYPTSQKLSNIKKKTVSLDQLEKKLTPFQKKVIAKEKKYYDLILALKETRKNQGLTQEELSELSDMPRTTITKIESGRRNTTLDTLMNLATAMGKKVEIRFV